MEKIKVLTSQNVSLEYPLALAGERIISNLIDLALKAGYGILIAVIVSLLEISNNVVQTVLILLPIGLYTPLSEIFMQGQTVGMRVRNTKVISLDGHPLTLGSILLRALLRSVDITMSGGAIALFSISLTRSGQRLGDIAAGTTVVKIVKDISYADMQFSHAPENYQVSFEQVKDLKEDEVRTIKEALTIFKKTKNTALVEVTAKKVKEMLDIRTDMSAPKFLDVVISDYNFLMGRV